MNLRAVDLNLLVVLDALLSERHVTRAGRRVGLSQPATSNALERLRRLFDDPLLERVPRGLKLTPRAEALRAPLAEVLHGASALIGSRTVDLAAIVQTVRLSVVDYWIPVLMGTVLEAIAARAPGMNLVCMPWSGAGDTHAGLEAGTLDLAMSLVAPSSLRFRTIRRERYVVAMRTGHPARRQLARRWLDYPHVVVSGQGVAVGDPDVALAEQGLRRRVAIVVPSFLSVPSLLTKSDLVALIPDTVARLAAGIAWARPPIPVPGFDVALAWHARRDADPATVFLRDQIAAAAAAHRTD
jgi:DNA-binding transcriptional LysR family regulator